MKNTMFLKAILAFIPMLFLAFNSPIEFIPNKIFHISKNSKLEIKGNTNVNSFNCLCMDEIEPQPFYIEHAKNRHSYYFKNTSMSIKINTLDCGNKLMNKDLRTSLNASKYPNIEIKLLEIIEDSCNPLHELKDWVKLSAKTNISLNGITKDYKLDITAKKISVNKFRFICTKPLLMSDFCVEPPTAFMGMVKVQDEIKISLDLEVEID